MDITDCGLVDSIQDGNNVAWKRQNIKQTNARREDDPTFHVADVIGPWSEIVAQDEHFSVCTAYGSIAEVYLCHVPFRWLEVGLRL